MTSAEIISDITSGDRDRVYKSAGEIISLVQSRDKIFPFIVQLEEIKKRTAGLELGGMLAPNRRFVDYAIRIIAFHRNSRGCTCALYADQYDGNNPDKEVTKGTSSLSV